MSQPSPDDDYVETLVQQLLDADVSPAQTDLLLAAARLTPRDAQQAADLLWLHGLLEHLLADDAGRREQRIQHVLRVIASGRDAATAAVADAADDAAADATADAPRPATHGPLPAARGERARSAWMRLGAAVAAAAVLLAAVVFWQIAGRNTALAAIDRAVHAAAQDVDRTYRLRLSSRQADGSWPETHVMLHVRGADKLVVEYPAPLGGTLYLGTNGRQGWLVPHVGPVFVNERAHLLRRWLEEHDVRVPFVHVRTFLEQLARQFALETLPPEPLPRGGPGLLDRIRGHRTGGGLLGFDRVDLWVHPETSIVWRAEAVARDAAGQPSQRLVLEFVGQRDLPSDWYEHAAHHQGRQVIGIAPRRDEPAAR